VPGRRLVVPFRAHYLARAPAEGRHPGPHLCRRMITPTTPVARDPELISASLGEELAMLHIDSGRYYFLNDIAAAIWELLETPTTPTALCGALVRRYDVSPEQCETEVLSLLDTLLQKEMIRVVQ
jgi:Coenzyme PQQ synthesis protein D (PqqD)